MNIYLLFATNFPITYSTDGFKGGSEPQTLLGYHAKF